MTAVAAEAMECLGGNGYVEEGPLARLYREAPLNGIWEGSANVICLDVLRAFARSPEAVGALEREVACAGDARLARAWATRRKRSRDAGTAEAGRAPSSSRSRSAIQGSLMQRHRMRRAAEASSRRARRARGRARVRNAGRWMRRPLAALLERARLRPGS